MSWRREQAAAGIANGHDPTEAPARRALLPVAAPRLLLAPPPVALRIASLESQAKLPAVVSSRNIMQWSGERVARAKGELKPADDERSTAPARSAGSARARATGRLLIISFGIFGGFALGIVASGSALITGVNLGQLVVQLDQLLLPRSANAPAPSRTADDSQTATEQIARGPVNPTTAVPSRSAPSEPQSAAALASTRPDQNDGAGAVDGSKDGGQAPSAPTGSTASADSESPRPATGLTGDLASAASASAGAATPAPSEPSWAALYARGHRAQSEGDLVAATHWYREAARLNPRHPAILYDLGYMLQVQGDIDGAIDEYRKVLELDPKHAYAQYDLGFLLQKKGDREGALVQYKKAAELNPENPYVYYDWARILESNDDLDGAKALYEKAAELAPERRPGTDARRRLAALDAR
jgi:tetratricopeptide (TPR) repeat protein